MQSHFDVSRETWDALERYVALLLAETAKQNLIAASTHDHIWARHIVDSAQLLLSRPQTKAPWVDVGSGAGLPAIVLALLQPSPVIMIESRRLRVEFLRSVIDVLSLTNASVHLAKVESWNAPQRAATITARAYAPLAKLLETTLHMAGKKTVWVLPKGRQWQNEVAAARAMWQFVFHVEQSVTDSESAILTISDVKAKGGRKA
nr:16S rRNA (guanine(527)-N(7))-methyltransferase RsmG [Sphingobium subterraneum]